MLAEITTAFASLKTMGELTALVLKTRVDSAVIEKAQESQAAMISLQSAMLSLQTQYQVLLREKDELEQRLIKMEDWNTEAQNYSLKEISSGVFVYVRKQDSSDGSPSHWLCANCYENKQKSILQRQPRESRGTPYRYIRCKSLISP